jgi:lipopolysaccharide export system ATP-binding protein
MSATAEPSIQLEGRGLVKRYGARSVVNEIDVHVQAGEIVGLLGPNGAGKTTTFYILVGMIRPNGGSVLFNGQDVTRLPMYKRARRGIGYLPQEPSVFRRMTVEENLMAILETLPLQASARQERMEALLQEMRLTHVRKNRGTQLSGGERRRVEISRARPQPSALLLPLVPPRAALVRHGYSECGVRRDRQCCRTNDDDRSRGVVASRRGRTAGSGLRLSA